MGRVRLGKSQEKRVKQTDAEKSRDLRLAEYHQAINYYFATAPADATSEQHDAACREIAKRTGI